jgi:hypothetical protein
MANYPKSAQTCGVSRKFQDMILFVYHQEGYRLQIDLVNLGGTVDIDLRRALLKPEWEMRVGGDTGMTQAGVWYAVIKGEAIPKSNSYRIKDRVVYL